MALGSAGPTSPLSFETLADDGVYRVAKTTMTTSELARIETAIARVRRSKLMIDLFNETSERSGADIRCRL